MQTHDTLAQTLTRLLRAGLKPVVLDNPPMDAQLYGAGWGTIVFKKGNRYWQAVLDPARRIVVVSRLS